MNAVFAYLHAKVQHQCRLEYLRVSIRRLFVRDNRWAAYISFFIAGNVTSIKIVLCHLHPIVGDQSNLQYEFT